VTSSPNTPFPLLNYYAWKSRLGLLINFNVYLIKDGITRIVNGLHE
jgi:hypothetical protein